MKKVIRLASAVVGFVLIATTGFGQKIDEARMERDIEVAENVLGTLLRQDAQNNRGVFYFNEVNGNYTPGYGVVFSLPFNEMIYAIRGRASFGTTSPAVVYNQSTGAYTIATNTANYDEKDEEKRIDSARAVSKTKYIEAMKTFLADYGDMISQLNDEEKIIVTNRPSGFNNWNTFGYSQGKRSLLSAEVFRKDVVQYKQGKITRDQLLSRIKIVNTESSEKVDTDLELLTSIFNRLYRSDLSKTYYTDGNNMYYERMNDYGAVYYMQVYSSNRDEFDTQTMPTQGLRKLSQEDRDMKVKDLYPAFEKELKENIVEYGRTVRSLKDSEQLIFNVRLTKCEGCGIPSTLEMSIPANVLKDYASGKVTKEAAIGKINIRKGPTQ